MDTAVAAAPVKSVPELEKRAILGALRALKRGDFTVELPRTLDGTDGEIADAFNEVVRLIWGSDAALPGPAALAGPVEIGAYSFVGPHSLIEANTRLGRGTLVCAGSFVRGEFAYPFLGELSHVERQRRHAADEAASTPGTTTQSTSAARASISPGARSSSWRWQWVSTAPVSAGS